MGRTMLDRAHLWVLLASCIPPLSVASAQDQQQKEYVFSGIVTDADCRELPASSFTIGPSGDRGESKDHLTVRCITREEGHSGMLSLTFTLDMQETLSVYSLSKIYSFRWGEAKGPQAKTFHGQFTYDSKLCDALADLFNSKVTKRNNPSSEPTNRSSEWSAGCYGDDARGTSMEIVLTTRSPEGL